MTQNSENADNSTKSSITIQGGLAPSSGQIPTSVSLDVITSEEGQLLEIIKCMDNIYDRQSLNVLLAYFSKTTYANNRNKIFDFFQKMILNPSLYIEYAKPAHHRRNSEEFSSVETLPRYRQRSTSFKLTHEEAAKAVNVDTKTKYSPLTALFLAFPRITDKFTVSEIDTSGKNLQICIMKLVPDPRMINKNPIPDLHYFQECCEAFRHILNVKKSTLSVSLVKAILNASFAIIFSIVDCAKLRNVSQFNYTGYIGEIISIVSTGLGCIQPTLDIQTLLNSFWVSLVLFSKGDFSVYFTWSVHLRRIASNTLPFTSVCSSINPKSVDTLINDVNIKSAHVKIYATSDEMSAAIKPLIPEVNIAALKLLSPSYGIFLLCIYTLEKFRAASGDLWTFFEYMDYSYNQQFDQIIDSFLEPIFATYVHHVSAMSETITKSEAVFPTAEVLLRSFLVHGSRRSRAAASITSRFFTKFTMAILNRESWQVFMNSKDQLSKNIMLNFSNFFKELVKIAAADTPTLLFTIFAICAVREQAEARALMFNELYENLPPGVRSHFSDYYAVISMMQGMSFYIPENLDAFDNVTKARYLVIKITKTNDISLLEQIPYKIPTREKVRLWSMVFCESMKLADDLVDYLAKRYIHTYMSKKGIFSSEYNADDIREQTAIFSFFTYLIKLNTFTSKIIPQLYFLKDGIMLKHAGACHCYTTLLYLIISVMQCKTAHEFETAGNMNNMIVLLDVACRVIAMSRTPGIHMHITLSEVALLYKIIPSIKQLVDSNKATFVLQNTQNPSLSITMDQTLLVKFTNLILFCLAQVTMYFSTYANPTEQHLLENDYINTYWVKPRYYYFNEVLPIILTLTPTATFAFVDILNVSDDFIKEIPNLVKNYQSKIANEENLVHFIARYAPQAINTEVEIAPTIALTLIQPELLANPTTSKFVTHALYKLEERDAMLMVPQLVQSIRFDKCKAMREFLVEYAKTHEMFAHRLLWNIANEKGHPDSTDPKYARRLPKIEGNIIRGFSTPVRQRQMNEFGLIEELDRISQRLKPLKIEERKDMLITELKAMNLSSDLYVPSRPELRIVGINAEDSTPLKSHSRVPILVNFKVQNKEGQVFPYGCIFKIQDDVRTDCLMIQLIDKFGVIFDEAGLDTFVCPYKVFTTGYDRGVIELIEHASSRHDIGMKMNCELLHYFTTKFGPIGSPKFNAAQDNFIKSLATYSLICYLFQVKDRHNANIMIDDEGHIIHIDFGFIFEISPGGNIKFERAPFKLTKEYVNLLGGSIDSVPFQRFVKLFMRCFLAAQARYIEICNIVELMMNAGLSCFNKNSIKWLKDRFALTKSANELPDYIKGLITSSLDSVTTYAYDSFQNSQNNIFYC